MGIYERIKTIAQSKGYSINRLEKELSLPRSSISKYNKNAPSVERVQKIADFLGVTVSDISGESSNQPAYYLNPETAQMAQELFENKELRALFSTARDAKPDDLKTAADVLLALKRKEEYNGDDPA